MTEPNPGGSRVGVAERRSNSLMRGDHCKVEPNPGRIRVSVAERPSEYADVRGSLQGRAGRGGSDTMTEPKLGGSPRCCGREAVER